MRIMVSGCFDLLHSGHVAFLENAARLGELHVAIGSDRTIAALKGRPPVCSASERLYLVQSLRCVASARISRGIGIYDFLPEIPEIKPNVFVVNHDGDSGNKRAAVEAHGVQYVVADREPRDGLPPRSTTALRGKCRLPYRLDIAGGWLDQPFVGKLASGPVVNCSIEPDADYEFRSGMASSTRKAAEMLWGPQLPADNSEKLAKALFAVENPPGTVNVAGSQDAIGVVYPGINRIDYSGQYWPDRVTTNTNPDAALWLQQRLWLRFTDCRPVGFEVLSKSNVNTKSARKLADAATCAWYAIEQRNAAHLGEAMAESFAAQLEMFPLMLTPEIAETIARQGPGSLGYKVTGAGGGGYVVFLSERPIDGAIQPRIRLAD
jgi:cytidyltransferase-like protein